MSDIIDLTKKDSCNIVYFASANSGDGFISYFGKVFDPNSFERIFILKGGPGTGKSTLMKKAKKCALSYDLNCEEILCSSDPDSLDGIIINTQKGKLAIIDGTAPHVRDTIIPGAVDELLDLGKYWNSKALFSCKNKITELQNQKQNAYENAYAYLSSAKRLLKRKQLLLRDCINTQKLYKAVGRFFKYSKSSTAIPSVSYKLSSAISAKGSFRTDIYKDCFGESVAVYGPQGSSYIVLSAIKDCAALTGSDVILSPTPLIPDDIDGIFVKSINTSFFDAGNSRPTNSEKCINAQRFIDPDALRTIKPALRSISKLYEASMSNAYSELAKSRSLHFSLEQIYTRAMDFDAFNEAVEYISEQIKAFCD